MDSNLASVRNLLRLTQLGSFNDAFRIAEALTQLESKFKAQQEDGGDVCCPLPFSLQDLCLLVVISDLDCHQVKLLASLPHWLRHRLLNILPALDLGRLEHTPLAIGVDVDAIWNSRWKEKIPRSIPSLRSMFGLHRHLQSPSSGEGSQSAGSFFQLNVSKINDIFSTDVSQLSTLPSRPLENVLLKEMRSAFQALEECKLPHGKKCLLNMASDVLTNSPRMDLNVAANKLISIQGDIVFSNLLTGSTHQPCPTSKCSQRVWKKQATALAVNVFSVHFQQRPSLFGLQYTGRDQACNIQLTPHRLLPILYRRDHWSCWLFLLEIVAFNHPVPMSTLTQYHSHSCLI